MYVPSPPHAWQLTLKEAIGVQRELAPRVITTVSRGVFRLAAGVDASFSADGMRCVAGVVLWDIDKQAERESHTASCPLTFPYVPGLLSFREAPAILAVLRKMRQPPDVILCDGQGLAHPRRLGIASHIGVLLDRPTIGCAKSRLVGEHREPGAKRGAAVRLLDRGKIIGCVLRTRDNVKPLYISIGHRMDLRTARSLVLRCGGGYRLPEPTRRADRLVSLARRTETA